MPDYQVPWLVHEDIVDINNLLLKGRLRSATKLMMTLIETVVWLRMPGEREETAREDFCGYLETRVLASMVAEVKPSAEDLWHFRNGALHTSSRRGQRGAVRARPLNWSLERSCGVHSDTLIWPSIDHMANSVDIKINDFWTVLRRHAYEDMDAALREQPKVVLDRMKLQMAFCSVSSQPQPGYLKATPCDCTTGQPLQGSPIYIKQEPGIITVPMSHT